MGLSVRLASSSLGSECRLSHMLLAAAPSWVTSTTRTAATGRISTTTSRPPSLVSSAPSPLLKSPARAPSRRTCTIFSSPSSVLRESERRSSAKQRRSQATRYAAAASASMKLGSNADPRELQYAVQSHLDLHRLGPDSLIAMEPCEGEDALRTEDILSVIAEQGEEVCLPLAQPRLDC